ncbi:DEAD/DEAH box helicase [Aestuariicoccus sp. MJ-SS9]|uniref:DEAD/DEAH box helicase n=1 Tax=Aestuariicoccus sp. MJ-SS9 TaxID=3079855 RepID=UPI00290FCD6C|nr:DEAD/DEAH box helicase [Aestuariicoccus sp. MJ-SS9]MDU8909960.1 DEAD/DEAH box helicase [Aestuariicoccus sp. MJ-SS9]
MIPTLSDALAERGFDTLTDVQQAVTAPDLVKADLLVSAQTGSGKTVGFGLAIAPTLMGEAAHLGPPAAPLALIVAPTRELAMQVSRELAWLFGKAGARVATCIGGMDARDERRALERGAHIVVGTPGRLCDHINRGALDLADIRAIVLDEADEMLDLGFREDLEFILGKAPETRRTLLFSATVPPSIAALAKQFQRDAVRVTTLSKGNQHADIAYQAIQVAPADTEHAVINLLRFHDAPTAIVFANTRATVARLTARLANRGFAVVSLSGELSQDERSHALQAMRDGRAKVCVATDVAARGIDLPNLDLVVHADLPNNTEALLHRSGRTGRAGRKGISALIVPDKAAKKAERLLKWAKIEAEWRAAPSPEDIRALDEARLLSDPAWDTELSPEEAAFAAALLERHKPEEIAAACLRLYRAGLSAPEELGLRSAPAPRAAFGPSGWLALSVGRDAGAEPRWILPLLCRTGNIEKSAIGKIRVTPQETYVEIAEAAIPALRDRLSAGGVLERDIRARLLDAPPQEATSAQPRTPPRPPKGPAPRRDGPRTPARRTGDDTTDAPPAARDERPVAKRAPRPADSPAPRREGPKKPAPRPGDGARSTPPAARKEGRPHGPATKGKKPKPATDTAPGKPRHKKPGGPKPDVAAKPKGPQSKRRPDASDPSKSLGRAGAKRRQTTARGGDAPPRRKG